MRPTHLLASLLGLCICAAVHVQGLRAQGATSSTVSGVVTDQAGRAIPRALVTLTSVGAGASREATTSTAGAFSFSLVSPGGYEVRVEALGFRPVLARTLSLVGGERVSLSLALTEATPPVTAIDTVALAGSSATGQRPDRIRLTGAGRVALPYRLQDLASVTSMSSELDAWLGSRGLPGSMSLLYVDGVPIYRAPHPLLEAEQPAQPGVPEQSLAGVSVLPTTPDLEWAGSAGGYVAASSRASTGGEGVEIEGSWSGTPLWSPTELDLTKPSLTSYHAAGRANVELEPGVSSLFLAAGALQLQTPLAPRLGEAAEDALAALDAEVLLPLASPSTETLRRYSGMAGFRTQPSGTSRFFLRGSVDRSERSFEGLGPVGPAYGLGLPEQSTDFSIAGGSISEYRPGLTLELRGGVSGSYRTFEPALDDLASAYLVGLATPLGTTTGGPGRSSRTDIVLAPVVRARLGLGVLEGGLSARTSTHRIRHSPIGPADFLFADAEALLAGRGLLRSLDSGESEFTTREFGAFAQYALEPAPGLSISVGARFDYEMIPSDAPEASAAWEAASGLENTAYPTAFEQVGGGASIEWNPTVEGGTTLFASGSVHNGDLDPAALHEVFSQGGEGNFARYLGSGLDWPGAAVPGGASVLTSLSLLGPDARPPRSAQVSAGVVQTLAAGWSLRLEAALRRTDFLLRRRNLNLPVLTRGTDDHGRAVWGSLVQDGSLLVADADARRFAEFGDVWALDPDGWSVYHGLSVELDHQGELLDLHASYTRSQTEDNWVGASAASPWAALSPLVPSLEDDWESGTSDFDVPHRVAASATLELPGAPGTSLSAVYRFRSGRPFTPGYRRGVDANADGSFENDVAFIPAADVLGDLAADWGCLADNAGSFAERNSCRGPVRHQLDARLQIGVGRLAGRDASLVVDVFNLVESADGVIDHALLLVDAEGSVVTSPEGVVTLPVAPNPDFGRVLFPSSRGRMFRIGFRIGGLQ